MSIIDPKMAGISGRLIRVNLQFRQTDRYCTTPTALEIVGRGLLGVTEESPPAKPQPMALYTAGLWYLEAPERLLLLSEQPHSVDQLADAAAQLALAICHLAISCEQDLEAFQGFLESLGLDESRPNPPNNMAAMLLFGGQRSMDILRAIDAGCMETASV